MAGKAMKMSMSKAKLAERMCDFFRCPNSGRVIDGMKGDDKVLCSCGKVNPACPREYPVVHIKSFLPRVTVHEYMEQEGHKE